MPNLKENGIGTEGKIYITSITPKPQGTHRHTFFELVYVLEGKAYHTLDGEKRIIEKGDCFIIDYGSYHCYDFIEGADFRIVNCLFRSEFIDEELKNCESFKSLLSHHFISFRGSLLSEDPTHTVIKDGGDMLPLINRMSREFENESVGYSELIRCLLIEVLILFLRALAESGSGVNKSDFIRQMTEYIYNHSSEDIPLSFFCEKFNYSLAYLSVKFKEETGMCYSEYLQRARLRHALFLLRTTDKKIVEISRLVGYSDIKFFYKVFKKHLGITPGELRNSFDSSIM